MLRRLWLALAMLLAFGATAAQAVTLDNLKEPTFEPIYGDYAPGGDCSREPSVTIDATGFTFHVGGKTTKASKVEFAASFLGPEYDGISMVFFPFPLGDYEFGRVIMTANADEKPGLLRFEDNRGPGEKFSTLEAALIKAAEFQRCGGTAAASQAAAPAEATADAPTPWELVPTSGGQPLAYVSAAGSAHVEAFSVFCSEGKPAIAMLLKSGMTADRLTVGWQFASTRTDIVVARSNGEGTFWQAYLAGSGLLERLLREAGTASLLVNGAAEGTASLKGSTTAIKTALATCAKL